jgi:hypothetical protein
LDSGGAIINAIAATSHAIEKKAATLNTAVSQDATKESPSGEKSAMAQNQPVIAGPTPPAVFILFNGERLETNHYLLNNNSLRVQQGGTQRTIPGPPFGTTHRKRHRSAVAPSRLFSAGTAPTRT